MKRSNKLLVLVASLVMTLTMTMIAPVAAYATSATISNPRVVGTEIYNKVSTWDLVTFGNYPKEKGGAKQPIVWRVLNIQGDKALLLAEETLYNDGPESLFLAKKIGDGYADSSITWKESTLRSWLNGYGGGQNANNITYTADGNNFISQAFSKNELDLINLTTISLEEYEKNDSGEYVKVGDYGPVYDKVFILSSQELSMEAYGFKPIVNATGDWLSYSDARRTKRSDYTGTYGQNPQGNHISSYWVRDRGFRIPMQKSSGRGYVDTLGGTLNDFGWASNIAYVRPALWVNWKSPLISYVGTVTADWNSHGECSAAVNYFPKAIPQGEEIVSSITATIAYTQTAYTGKDKKPAVTVKRNGTTLKDGTDYTVTYKNNKAVGKASVEIKGKAVGFETITKTFNIVPKTPAISSLKSSSKKTFTVKTKAPAKSTITGYELSYRVKGTSKWTVKKYKTTKALSKTIKSLKSKKTYQVRLRTYKNISNTTYWSSYSTVKTVKVK